MGARGTTALNLGYIFSLGELICESRVVNFILLWRGFGFFP
jgi:hypothetical protein